ncbi:hypothetical protein CLPUN_43620 [Clostridium puniceum]|uniref:HD domain-containing protein n=1 Tax=Clostridium puniceum TaxID=29367 RepID=A0A1S8T7Q6_9CLOT|nr:hypothetical protein CLPUN_43620 [Clostridium puniceum]
MKNLKELILEVPSVEEAKIILDEGSKLNPGLWIDHSFYAGQAAQLIAREDRELDENIALVLGMLHDIWKKIWSNKHET